MDNNSTTALDLTDVSEQWRDFTEQALRTWNCESFSVRRLLGGKSGATVMLVDIKTPQHNGQGILKLSDKEALDEERQRQELARSVSPDLARRIPMVTHASADGSRSALLMTVAGHGLLETEILANARGNRLNLASQKISSSLLEEWNRLPSFAGVPVRADAPLAEWLEHRIGPRSHVPDVLAKQLHLPPDCSAFRYGGIDYPNPYGFSMHDFPGCCIQLLPGRGRFHGDLHAENVLVSGPRVEDYYFIDFSFFRAEAPIFFDHAYLELHLLLVQREKATHERWHGLCRSLVGLNDTRDVEKNLLDQDDHGLLWTVGMIRAEIFKWISRAFPDRLEDLKKQVLLSRIAAGLNFANKRSLADDVALSDKKKIFSLLYAATATKELFDYCRLPVANDGPIARVEHEIPPPFGHAWREVWDACGGFNGSRGAYVLLAGRDVGQLSDVARAQLGRLPWSLVIDFDRAGTAGPLAVGAGATLKLRRGLHHVLPHQAVNIDFETGTCWFFADADLPADGGAPLSLAQWRQRTLPALREVASKLLKATSPGATYLVVLDGSIDPKRLEFAVATVQDQITGTLETVVISRTDSESAYAVLAEGNDTVRNIVCDWQDMALGVHEMLGDASDESSVWLPVRDPASKSIRREKIGPAEMALYAETIDIVSAGPVTYVQDGNDADIADFLRGNTITWRELDLHLDVDRDLTRGHQGVIQRIRMLLASSPTESFAIEHTPGAGGTTVARRLAWELRDEYPCVILKSLTDSTPDVLEALFQRSNMPLLIVVEAARLPSAQRDHFFNLLKGRSIRFVILDVRRRHSPRNTETSVAIIDPMAAADTQRFLLQYEPRAPQDRRKALRDLAGKPELGPYRSPFFFGLYAFERDFIRVPDFVRQLLEELPEKALHVVAHLALIRRYSQEALPASALRLMLGLPKSKDNQPIYAMLGETLSKIVMFDGKNVWIAHPLLAEEILRQHLQPSESNLPEAWRINLSAFCLQFIQEMAVEGLRESGAVTDILSDLFIERGTRQDSATPQQFSDLLNDIRSRESQRRVMEALCDHFPDTAHFWSHLGRHISICGSGTFEEAEAMLLRAIAIEPGDDAHRHTLGMVYRGKIRSLLEEPLAGTETVAGRLTSITPIFTQAEDCFAKARELNRDSQYPVVTPIQMIIETFERLARLGGQGGGYQAFLNSTDLVAEWCRGKIVAAQELLSVLHHQEANSVPSSYRLACDSRLQGVLGNFEGMVRGLTELLGRPDVALAPVRRLLANGYVQQIDSGTATRQSRMLRRVVELMEDNLAENPSSGHDVRTWFRAYRMLPDFTLVRALERMTQWSLVSDDIDAKYYLYILHFIAAREGIPRSTEKTMQYIELCRRQAPVLQSKRSFEWWAASERHRPCPLVHHSELGPWSKARDFFEGEDKLDAIEGRIDQIQSPQSGLIMVSGIPAFFVPRTQFYRGRDLNASVTCYLGFSYEGLRAWNVRRVST